MSEDAETALKGLGKRQRGWLLWFLAGNEVEVSLIGFTGRSKEWPTRAELQRLNNRGLLTITKYLGGWRAELSPLGLSAAQSL